MTGEGKEYIRLRIAFIGSSVGLTHYFFKEFARENAGQIEVFNEAHGRILLYDGTLIQMVTPRTVLDGLRFDQVVVARSIEKTRRSEMHSVLYQLQGRLAPTVPEEFQFIIYNPYEEGQA